jgi:hypothetical protein
MTGRKTRQAVGLISGLVVGQRVPAGVVEKCSADAPCQYVCTTRRGGWARVSCVAQVELFAPPIRTGAGGSIRPIEPTVQICLGEELLGSIQGWWQGSSAARDATKAAVITTLHAAGAPASQSLIVTYTGLTPGQVAGVIRRGLRGQWIYLAGSEMAARSVRQVYGLTGRGQLWYEQAVADGLIVELEASDEDGD